MNILIITPYYEPDLGPSAPMFKLLCTELSRRGHKLTIIAMVPHYPAGFVDEGYKGNRIKHSHEDGVEVIRVPIPSMNRENLIKRMVQFVVYQLGATISSLKGNYDCVIISNPFFCTLLPLFWQSIIKNKPVIYSVNDVYPDVGIKLGIFKQKTVVKLVGSLEHYCYNHSTIIQILSSAFKPALLSSGVDDKKISLIYPWVDINLIQPASKENSFSRDNGINNEFVVLYAGNIGLSQGFESLITAAEALKNHQDIRFVIVGDGAGLEDLQTQTDRKQLANIRFIPFQPRERLPEVLASADVSLVILRQGIGENSLPSKVFSIMASGRPIIASVDEGCETCKLIQHAEAGICVPPGDGVQLAEAIIDLKQNEDRRKQLGQNGRSWVEQNHSPHHAGDQFEKIIFEAVGEYQS